MPDAEVYLERETPYTPRWLLNRLRNHESSLAIIGLGYVGLPLAVAFAEAGLRVTGIDVSVEKVEALNKGRSYVSDIPAERLKPLVCKPNGSSRGTLRATSEFDSLAESDAVIICVPTPLGKTKDPEMSFIVSAVNEIARRMHPGMLVVLESTTYPGTTEEIIVPCLENANGSRFTVGQDLFVAFSPERIDPGRTDWTVHTTPKVIGGVTPQCLEMARALYGSAIRTVVPVSSPRVAEMVKLLENTFRAVNIALVNEVAIMCDTLGIDVWEVIDAAKTKPFGFMPFYPGPGLGGHCIPVDPHYLAWKLKTLNYNARFIQLAAEINFSMPHYVLGKIADALNRQRKALNGSRVLVLGVAYKPDVGDVRESPALDLINLLRKRGAEAIFHDPHVSELEIDGTRLQSVSLSGDTLSGADCAVIVTPHSEYRWDWIVDKSRLVIDTRNATACLGRTDRVVRL